MVAIVWIFALKWVFIPAFAVGVANAYFFDRTICIAMAVPISVVAALALSRYLHPTAELHYYFEDLVVWFPPIFLSACLGSAIGGRQARFKTRSASKNPEEPRQES